MRLSVHTLVSTGGWKPMTAPNEVTTKPTLESSVVPMSPQSLSSKCLLALETSLYSTHSYASHCSCPMRSIGRVPLKSGSLRGSLVNVSKFPTEVGIIWVNKVDSSGVAVHSKLPIARPSPMAAQRLNTGSAQFTPNHRRSSPPIQYMVWLVFVSIKAFHPFRWSLHTIVLLLDKQYR